MKPRPVVFAMLLALSACVSSPLPTLHELAGPAPASAAGQVAPAAPLRVVIATTVVPHSVDRPQLVVRNAQGEVERIDTQRWAEPLDHGIARVVAAELGAQLDDAIVWSTSSAAPARPDVRLTLEVTRFESELGTAATVEVLWLARAGGAERSGRAMVRRPVAGPGYDALVAAHREGLQALSRHIAAGIRGLRADAGTSGGTRPAPERDGGG